jgi:protein-tyrosine-phosphatase
MAEGFFNRLMLRQDLLAESAGVGAVDGLPAAENAVQVMSEYGIDISRHRSRNLSECRFGKFAFVVAMDSSISGQMGNSFPSFGQHMVWEVDDPYGESVKEYRKAADIIRQRVEDLCRGIKSRPADGT